MKKYLLVVFCKIKSGQICKDLAVALSPIVDSPFMKFNHMDGSIVFHFGSEVDQTEITDYVYSMLFGITESFILSEVNDRMSVSFPFEVKEHLFDLEHQKEEIEMKVRLDKEYNEDEEDDDSFVALLLEEIKSKVKKPSLDFILDKIKSKGLTSLSQFEKDTLDEYSK